VVAAIQSFTEQIHAYKSIAESKDAYEAAMEIARGSGIVKELYEDKTVEGLNRYENVQELLNAIKEFVDNPETPDKSLGAFLQDVALLTDADDKDEPEDKVQLMSIHQAKGLEFRNVFIVGMEEDLFPSQMMLSSRADLEEERRLFYVAITRAEKKLTLSFAETRYRFGKLKSCEPSRFLSELDPKYLNISRRTAPIEKPKIVIATKPQSVSSPVGAKPKVNYIPSADFKPSDTSLLAAGMKVEHPKFGFGIVKAMDISGNDRKAIIDFNNLGEKTLILSFAKLKIHSS
jgi:DNA helicase-2/ATP-dependent DNA helicase PcrA